VFKKLRGSFLLGIGYMLSPLSWWNDLFFNLPIALLFGYLVSWMNPDWFLPFTIVGYWLSNVLGIVMMQMGAMDMFLGQEQQVVAIAFEHRWQTTADAMPVNLHRLIGCKSGENLFLFVAGDRVLLR